MKIAVDVMSIRQDGSAGGATGFAIELIKGFAKNGENKVYALCSGFNKEYLKRVLPSNVELLMIDTQRSITRINFIDRLLFRITGKLDNTQKLKEKGIDILYCPFSAVFNKEQGIPVVSTILDIQHEFYPQFFSITELEHRRKFYREIVKKAETVTCISDFTKESFCEKYGYPKARAHTIYIAIQNRFSKTDDNIMEKLNIKGKKYIIYPANFWEHKNHKLLLMAFAMYTYENEDAFLVLTGNPLDQKEYYEEIITKLGISEKVIISGYVTTEELYSIIKNAKGLIFPSLFEGFGIPVVEAMQQHLLIACSNATSLMEIGCDSIHYFDPRRPDEIVRGFHYLYENEMTDDIIADYDKKLKIYQSDIMVQEYMDLFHKVVSDKELLVFEECCKGVYEDGWAGRKIYIQLKNRKNELLLMTMEVPDFVKDRVEFTVECGERKKKYSITSGNHIDIEEMIMDENAVITINFKRCWTPKELLHSTDERILSVMIKKIDTVDKNGIATPLERY